LVGLLGRLGAGLCLLLPAVCDELAGKPKACAWAASADLLAPAAIAASAALQLVVNAVGLRSRRLLAKTLLLDVPVAVTALQAYFRLTDVLTWSWFLVFWPLWALLLSADAAALALAVASDGVHRCFWKVHCVLLAVLTAGLYGYAAWLDGGRDPAAWAGCFVAFALVLWLFSLVLACAYLATEKQGAAAPDPLKASTLRLFAVTNTFFKPAEEPEAPEKWPVPWACCAPEAKSDAEAPLQAYCPEQCTICCDKEADAVFLHCGHGGICRQCALLCFHRHGECPICRQGCAGVMKVEPLDGRHVTGTKLA